MAKVPPEGSKPIAERMDALNALIDALLTWQSEHCVGQPMQDTQQIIDAAFAFLGKPWVIYQSLRLSRREERNI